MIGLQVMCFWVIITFNTMRHTFLYQKLRVDTRSGYVNIQEEIWR